jgi:hypothetical protein
MADLADDVVKNRQQRAALVPIRSDSCGDRRDDEWVTWPGRGPAALTERCVTHASIVAQTPSGGDACRGESGVNSAIA